MTGRRIFERDRQRRARREAALDRPLPHWSQPEKHILPDGPMSAPIRVNDDATQAAIDAYLEQKRKDQ
jgi:hypothetical protein